MGPSGFIKYKQEKVEKIKRKVHVHASRVNWPHDIKDGLSN